MTSGKDEQERNANSCKQQAQTTSLKVEKARDRKESEFF
jgi:hypothetical protein